MKMTNFMLVNFMNTLEAFQDKKLPQKISYAITRNLMNISEEYQVYAAQLKKIFDAYADYIVRDEQGTIRYSPNGIPIVEEAVTEEFHEQLTDLLNIEFDMDMYLISLDIFDYEDKDRRYDVLSADDIMKLQMILCASNI